MASYYCDVKRVLTLTEYLYMVNVSLQQPHEVSSIVSLPQMKQMRHRAP